MNKVFASSKTVEWVTPREIFDPLDAEFGFTLDACATKENAKCSLFFSREQDGLKQRWAPHVVWCNPPYGRQISKWVQKASEEASFGATIVMLIPARTDTHWWHDHVAGREIRFVRGRIYFESPGMKRDRAPFPSAIAVFHPRLTHEDN